MMRTRAVSTIVLGGALSAALLLAGCAPTGTGATQDPEAVVTVWVDGVRLESAQKWADAQTDFTYKIESVEDVGQKVPLAISAGSDIPDVVFLPNPDDIASLLTNSVNYPLGLTGIIDEATIAGFAEGTIERCTYDGVAYCLPNDLAPSVMLYNKTLLDEFGYDVPETFEQWGELGASLAADQPGYSLGSASDLFGLNAYYGSSGCPLMDVQSNTEVRINVADESCTRVSDVLGPLMANGSVTTVSPFDADYLNTTVAGGKLVATLAPAWFALYGIKASFPDAGQWAAAPMPTWDGADTNYSGPIGGGIWVAYSQTKNQAGAAAIMTAMTTENDIIGTGEATYPAFAAAADFWLENVNADGWYAEDPAEVFRDAASKINPASGFVRYNAQAIDSFQQTVIADRGADITAALAEFGSQITAAAKQTGYTVVE